MGEVFTMVLECLLLVSFPTVECTSVSLMPFMASTHTRRTRATSFVQLRNLSVPKCLPSVLDTHPIPLTLCDADCKCSQRSRSRNGCTRGLLTALARLSKMKELLPSSRVLEPMPSVRLERPWYLCSTP